MVSQTISLPEILGGISEAQLLRWLVDIGDMVKIDQAICEIHTDKAVVELPSTKTGRVSAFLVQEGDMIHTGDGLLRLNAGNISDSTKLLASPSVRRLVRKYDIDPQHIQGSGEHGRVLSSDIQDYLEKLQTHNIQPYDLSVNKKSEDLSLTRRIIAERLSTSLQQKPHVTYFEECDVNGLVHWYKEFKVDKLTYTPFLLKVLAQTVQKHQRFNAHYNEEKQQLYTFAQVDIGVAVQTEKGLLVPVLRNVDRKSVENIAEELQELVQKAKTGSLLPREMQDSTITLSNAGSLGGIGATPIIQSPEVAILATHRIERRPVVLSEGRIEASWRMNISLSFDHRVLDGTDAMLFSQTFQGFTKNPLTML